MTLNKTLFFWLCYGLLCLNQAATGELACRFTTSERCSFGSSAGGCVSNENATRFQAFENSDGHYYCTVNPSYGYWARCDTSCLQDGEPTQFENDDDPMAVMCKTVPMECKFPFTHQGVTYHECTKALLENSEAQYDDEEEFLWCATQVDADGNYIKNQWGVCDLNTCGPEEPVDPTPVDPVEPITAEVNILAESNSAQISATISFRQDSPDAPLRIEGHISGLPQGQHGLHVHQNGDTSDQCMAAGPHFNPTETNHGSQISNSRHAGDFGNIQANADGEAEVDITLPADSVSTLFGPDTLLSRTLVIHAEKDDLGQGGDAGSLATGNAGARLACGIIEPQEAPTQSDLAKIIIIVLVVIIVLLILLIAALLVYCCKKKRQAKGTGEDGVPFQNGDMKKRPLAYDELSIPFIDASPTPTPKVGRSTERLSFFNRTPSIGRSRGSLSKDPAEESPAAAATA